MKIGKFKAVTLMSVVASVVLMSGCGDTKTPTDSNDTGGDVPIVDTTAPIFTSSNQVSVMEDTVLSYTVVATDDNGSVTYSEDKADFDIGVTSGILTFPAQSVNGDTDFTVTVTATDPSGNSATQLIIVTVREKGIANRTIMPEGTGRVFQDKGNGTVLNTHTGFLWEKTADDNVTFDGAKAYCQSKGDGWKLPTRTDLFKLINYSKYPASIKAFDDVFGDPIGVLYWSSEEINSTYAWAVSFIGKGGDIKTKKDRSNVSGAYVRCVKGEYQDPSFRVNDDGTVSDLDTKLRWKTGSSESNYQGADQFCTNYAFRLPTINELRSIIEYTPKQVFGKETVSINGVEVNATAFENGFGDLIWTSTNYETDNKKKVLYVTPTEISDSSEFDINTTARAVCVKDD